MRCAMKLLTLLMIMQIINLTTAFLSPRRPYQYANVRRQSLRSSREPEISVSQRLAQSETLAALLEYYGWTYVSVVVSDDFLGHMMHADLQAFLRKAGICQATFQLVPTAHDDQTFDRIITTLSQHSNARAVILLTTGDDSVEILRASERAGEQGRFVWLSSSRWMEARQEMPATAAHGALVLQLHMDRVDNSAIGVIRRGYSEIHNSIQSQQIDNSGYDMDTWYDVMNVKTLRSGRVMYVPFARWRGSRLYVSCDECVTWPSGALQRPESVCSSPCGIGQTPSYTGNSLCCWVCVPDPDFEMSSMFIF